MDAIRLAFALIRIPRLFASLLLIPLLFGLALVTAQVVLTGMFLSASRSDPAQVERRIEQIEVKNFFRAVLYGDGAPLKNFTVCRWNSSGHSSEAPPADPKCRPDRLDAALHVEDPQTFDPSQYLDFFRGNVERLHICRACRPDLTVRITSTGIQTDAYSLQGVMLLSLVRYNRELNRVYLEASRGIELSNELLGSKYLNLQGLRDAVNLDTFVNSNVLGLNIAVLVLVALFLALKAHRKVLDYFARNGALLPMVAAAGQGTFYSSLWLLTGLRVAAFLLAAVPGIIYLLPSFSKEADLSTFLDDGPGAASLWLVAIISGLSLATLIASIGELKHRHNLLSFAYKYIPLILCVIGCALWAVSFFAEGAAAALLRHFISAAPVLGIGPMLVAPVFKPGFSVLAIHSVLSVGAMVVLLRGNARWFAAHLEEL